MMKIRVGILFGGSSREREISFAGGRTVYDNLNKSIFEPVPLFLDSLGNIALLNWEFIYKGTIRDFFPPVEFLPEDRSFQLYQEALNPLNDSVVEQMIAQIGKKVKAEELKNLIDFAFLCLHGENGEDGRIQGMLEFLQIPYSGSSILSSAIGMNKAIQKELMRNAGFNSPAFMRVPKSELKNISECFQNATQKIGFPLVIKPANQGSSIGVSIIMKKDETEFANAIRKAFFITRISQKEWEKIDANEKHNLVRQYCDIREGVGCPLLANGNLIHQPAELLQYLNSNSTESIELESINGESDVLIEGFIDGKEFSCIVIEDENGKAIALPPTEIRKGKELFDYRSKYLPGLSRKITPIDLPQEQIDNIRKDCERLFYALHFDVYARIDGFLSYDGKIYLNDPNTTSGMMPSSFFFHQAAEIGLNPSQFLTFIIRTSIHKRLIQSRNPILYNDLLRKLDHSIEHDQNASTQKIKVGVILGGYSSERHISVESGRNVYEKLSSSIKYQAIPLFLTGDQNNHKIYQIPVNLLLKDNADDIAEKVANYKVHPLLSQIMHECESVTKKYAGNSFIGKPIGIQYSELSEKVDQVFIALHGRPGEDGAVQEKLDELKIPYNGSGKESSCITIDKYQTNEILRKNGFLVAEHLLVNESDWIKNQTSVLKTIADKIHYPFIAKPVDDGCSSAVKKIKSEEEFIAFAKLIFRESDSLDPKAAEILHIKPKEEFPQKKVILVEELIGRRDAAHFLEITGGMLSKFNAKNEIEFEVFEASEALSEGDVLSLEEKFLAGQGQNITPARYALQAEERQRISDIVKDTLGKAAKVLLVQGYCRIDAFVRVFANGKVEVIFIEVNSLPGMTPATCIFHQAAINHYKPYEFIDAILDFGKKRNAVLQLNSTN